MSLLLFFNPPTAFTNLAVAIEAEFSPGTWTDITDDADASNGMRIAYGIQGQGPLDCVAGTGECQFALRNDASVGAVGTYSPLHANVQSGWTVGTPLRVTLTSGSLARVKHRGKVGMIDPEPGTYRKPRAFVTSYDGMRDLAEADVREVTLQIGQSEDDLLTEICDALPSDAQPVTRDFDTGVDTFPYAFDDVGPGLKALTLVKDVAVSAFALVAMKGDGTLMLQNRQSRANTASAFTFDDTMNGLFVPADKGNLYNRVRVTIRPKTIDAAATTVLWESSGTVLSVASGQTVTLWVEYRDPDESRTLIGGQSLVNPPTATTDYLANSASDGSGSNLTGSIAITMTDFASASKLEITNNAAVTAYFVDGSGDPFLRIKGKGVYDLGPQTFEATSTQTYGIKPLPIELRYQSDASIAQSYATYVEAQYRSLQAQLGSISFLANSSADLMKHALSREPGDVITVTEAVTGVSAVDAVIQSISLEVLPSNKLSCTWGLAPAAPFRAWILDSVDRSQLDDTTKLGF